MAFASRGARRVMVPYKLAVTLCSEPIVRKRNYRHLSGRPLRINENDFVLQISTSD